MGQCPNCQQRQWAPTKCSVCGKQGCEGCFTFLFGVINKRNIRLQNLFACSPNCIDTLSKIIEKQILPNDIPPNDTVPSVDFFVAKTVFGANNPVIFNQGIIGELHGKHPLGITFNTRLNVKENPENPLWKNLSNYSKIVQAKRYETMREYENAAKIYKSLGLYEEVGRVRGKSNELVVRKTDVTFDLNALLQQIKEGGIVAIYRCPQCGANMKIGNSTSVNSLRICEHCGYNIEAVDIATFLKTVLS